MRVSTAHSKYVASVNLTCTNPNPIPNPARLQLMIQSWVEIEHYSVTTLLHSKCCSTKLPLREEFICGYIDLSCIYALCIGAAPLMEVLCYSTLNAVMRSKYACSISTRECHIYSDFTYLAMVWLVR